MKLWDIFVLKKILQMMLMGIFTWHMQRTRESRQSRLKTRPGWSPGSRQEDRIEPIWSLFEACSGTSWIDCRKKAGSLEFYSFAYSEYSYVSIESQIEWRNLSDPWIKRRRSNVELISYRLLISPPEIRLKIWSRTIWSSKFICFPVPNPIATRIFL